MHAHDGNKAASQTGTQTKQKDDTEVVHCFIDGLRVVSQAIGAKRLHTASQVSDAHGAGKSVAVDFAEGLYLHGAGEGNHGIRQKIPLARQEAYQQQEKDFGNQN